MFERKQTWYEIIEGKHANDYDNYGDYRSLDKALRIAYKLKSPYVRVDQFTGNFKDRDGDYTATLYEKKPEVK